VPVPDHAGRTASFDGAGRTALGRTALACIGTAIGLVFLTGLLGPSAAESPLPGGPGWLPPYSLDARPSPWLVTGLLLAAMLLGGAGLALSMRALRRGWAPDPRRLLAGSVLAAAAMVAVPPMGSADVLVYAAYGRLAATGADPYAQTAHDLAARGDPVGLSVEAPWQDTSSLYGPYGTAEQAVASLLGTDSTHATVFVLQLLGAVAFVVTGLLLLRLAGLGGDASETGDAGEAGGTGRARAALLWSLNPLLLFVIVNAAHIDGFALVWAAAALVAVRRSPVLAGALAGVACGVKLSLALYVLALAWALRHQPRRAAAMLAAAGTVVVAGYLPIGLHGLDQLRAASRYVSFGSPWRLAVGPLEALLGSDRARSLIGLGAWVLLAVLAWLLARALPGRVGGIHPDRPDRLEPPEPGAVQSSAVRAAAVLTFAWLLSAPYSLPWYDAAVWLPFAVMTASAFDYLLLARTTVMACAYVPGRVVDLPHVLDLVTRNLRGTVAPVAGLVLLVLLVRLGGRGSGLRQPPLPAEQPS
jgi:alpha-1,6-mannosyltransferase